MTIQLVNPPGIPDPPGYAQVSVATGTRTIHLSGQVARLADGTAVAPGDLAGQVEQAMTNVITALTGVDASWADVAKLTIYVVDWAPEKMEPLVEGLMRVASANGVDPRKPVTLIGVATLAEPDLLVEIEAVAIAD